MPPADPPPARHGRTDRPAGAPPGAGRPGTGGPHPPRRGGRGSPAGKAGGGKPEGDRRQPDPKWICRSGFSYDHRPSALKNVWLFAGKQPRSEEHTSELRHVSISYAVFCLKKINTQIISQV